MQNRALVINERKFFMEKPIIYTVIPCYNEEEVLPETSSRLIKKYNDLSACGMISDKSRIVLVNDGSKDATWDIITKLQKEHSWFAGINLSRNRGHQNALLAGLMTSKDYADAVISMDADLQDDINAMDEMIKKFSEGFDVVYGVRNKRKTDTFFKKTTAEAFYKLLKFLGANIIYNHADYRLMSKRALFGLEKFSEVNLFLRGIVPMVGYKSTCVYYERAERFAGESKYPLKKMLSFAIDGVTSLSVEPIRMITRLGIFIFAVSMLVLLYSVIRWICGKTATGWASLMCSVWAIGGLLLTSIGIIGEYVGKIYLETKRRPSFIISDLIGFDGKNDDNVGNNDKEESDK